MIGEMSMTNKKTEADLARHVIAWLEGQSWEVYQEVQLVSQGLIADIVAIQGQLVWIVECKTSFGLSVIEQAYNWRGKAHFVSVAVPESNRNTAREHRMADLVISMFGIGCIAVSGSGNWAQVRERVAVRLNRQARVKKIRGTLTPAHKDFASAGNSQGLHWTPFQQTCLHVRRAVEECPGITMKELIGSIKTHYASPASARASLLHWIEAGKVAGVRLEREGKNLRLHPQGEK